MLILFLVFMTLSPRNPSQDLILLPTCLVLPIQEHPSAAVRPYEKCLCQGPFRVNLPLEQPVNILELHILSVYKPPEHHSEVAPELWPLITCLLEPLLPGDQALTTTSLEESSNLPRYRRKSKTLVIRLAVVSSSCSQDSAFIVSSHWERCFWTSFMV